MSWVAFGRGAWRFARPAGSDAAQLVRAALAVPGAEDAIVSEAHVAVFGAVDPGATAAALAAAPRAPPAPGREHLVRVRYDGEDLGALGLPPAEVIARHTARPLRVQLLGFLPGFAYLGPVDPALVRPRRDSPRPRVPAGAVAVAGPYSGIYPGVSPGGWHLLGRAVGFAPFAADGTPALALGDLVRFAATDEVPGPLPAPPPLAYGPGRLHLGLPRGAQATTAAAVTAAATAAVTVTARVHPGPDAERFPPGALAAFLAARHVLSPLRNRVGLRLAAPPPPAPWAPLLDAAAPSAPMRFGAVQITPSGEPIVLGPEHPVTGGYPILAFVEEEDVEELYATAPGGAVSFVAA